MPHHDNFTLFVPLEFLTKQLDYSLSISIAIVDEGFHFFPLQRHKKKTCKHLLSSSQSRELFGPENFSGLFTGAFLGFRKAFLKAPDFLPRFSGMFSGNVTQGIARASNFQLVIGSKIAQLTPLH